MCCNDGQKGCRKPENLTDKPQDCSPEQIRQCHGDAAHPCTEPAGCEHPDRLGDRAPGDCSPEQVRQCHGEGKGHPCGNP